MGKRKKLNAVKAPKVSPRTWWLAFGVLAFLSAVFHFTNLYHPYSVVFDEFHFGKFVTAYTHKGDRIFDIHPPHAKLLIALGAKLGGYTGQFGFERISQPFVPGVHAETMRWMPALWGTLIPLMVFLILTSLNVSVLWAFTAGAVILLDNGLLVQTRIIALDGCLVLATLVALYGTIRALSDGKNARYWAILAGAGAGLAVGTKYTGLVAPVLFGATLFLLPWWEKNETTFRPGFLRLGLFGAAFFAVFITGWAFHFSLLTKPGYADSFYQATGNFWIDMIELQKTMLSANANITQGHPDQSLWWQWAFDRKPSYYWEETGARIYFVGNPVIWFSATVMAILLTGFLITKRKMSRWMWVVLAGFWMSWLPYAFVTRALFLYHYLPPLSLAIIATFFYLGKRQWKTPQHERWAALGILMVVLAGFWLVSPWTFGTNPNDFQKNYLEGYLLK